MIIKIQAGGNSGGWFYYDNAEEVFFADKEDIKSCFEQELGEDAPYNIIASRDDNPNMIAASFFKNDKFEGASGCNISFRRKDKMFDFYIDTEAYLMTDAGKTIERIS